MAGTTGHMDESPFASAFEPVPYRKPAQLRGRGQIDPQCVLPRIEPGDVRRIDWIRNENPRVVDQPIDPAIGAVERFLPD
jgi:hypothetical protein